MAKILKRRISLPLVLNGCISSLVLVVGMSPTFGAFSASISSQMNSAGAGTIVMQETDSSGTISCMSTDGGGLSLDSASCSTINKYGGNAGMRPGQSDVVVSYIQDVGTVAASSFSLTPGACAQSVPVATSGSATDLCTKIAVSIVSGASNIFSGTAAALGDIGTIDLLSRLGLVRVQLGLQIPFTVTTTMDASVDNSYQGLEVSQPLTRTFTS